MARIRSSVVVFLAILAVTAVACGPSTQTPSGASAAPAGSAAASTGAKPTAGGTITFALENDVSDLDPMLSGLFVDRNIMYAMYDSLVRFDTKGNIVPWLAEKWETSSDGKTVTFSLRKDVTFHDGSKLDAELVKWNIERYKTEKTSRRTADLAVVDKVTVVDANTVKFDLKQALAPLLANLVDRAGMILSRKAVENAGADFTLKPFKAGSGPFILTEAVKADHYTLEKNPNWWGKDASGNKLPYLDKVIVKPIENGDVRLTNIRTGQVQLINRVPGKDVPMVKSDPGLVFQEVAAFSWSSLVPNEAAGFIFSERRYVKAVSMALDREEILQKGPAQGVGIAGWGPLSPAHFAFDKDFKPWPKGDPEGAKKLIAEVGKGPLKFELLVPSGDPAIEQEALLIQAQLAKADITAEIKKQLFNDIVKLQQDHKHTGMTFVGWSGRLDPDGNSYDFVVTGSPNNDSSYTNTKVDDLMKQQRAESDPAKRASLLKQAQQIFVVDDPSRVWYQFGISPLVTVKALQGMTSYPDRIPRFETAFLQK